MSNVIGFSVSVLLLSAQILVVLFGALGLNGGAVVTVGVLTIPMALIAVLAGKLEFSISPYDLLFGVFVWAVAASFVTNPPHAEIREILLLGISACGYLACRRIRLNQLPAVSDALF